MLGEEGRGVPTIIEMVNHTRLDCVLGTTAGMRQGVAQATHHAAHRSAFGKLLIDQPLMQNVLADLCVESEAATVTAMRLARAYDESAEDEQEALFKRLATAVSKYWICKRGAVHAAEALECFGGNGYVEESGMPRSIATSPLNSIWEGSGNVICARRAARAGAHSRGARCASSARSSRPPAPSRASMRSSARSEEASCQTSRSIELACAQAGRADGARASGLAAGALRRPGGRRRLLRLAGSPATGGRAFGTLPAGTDFAAIIERHRPQL